MGTTSFANYLRFRAAAKKSYFTPSTEIKVEQGWGLETLLAVIINNLVREIGLLPENEKVLSSQIAEAYRSFGVDAFGFGANYDKQAGAVTQPVLIPSTTLSHHLEDLIMLVKELGYKKGVLIQLNNLDIGEIHEVTDMKYLLNALRDYMQINGSSWLLVGDIGLREFIARNVVCKLI